MPDALKTPVAFIIFNRPKCTRRVFAEIRKARPEKLYLVADGPRPHKEGEAERCAETRQLVENMIDWPCAVRKNYAEQNMGCGQRVPSGLDWVFEQEEAAIIMEDDIFVDPSFFPFCEAMLERYRDDNAIMQIGCYNRFNLAPPDGDYFISRYCDIWGWATWRRAWAKFKEIDKKKWSEIKQSYLLKDKCLSKNEALVRARGMSSIMDGKINAWGMRWDVARLMAGGKGIVPGSNLVKNIGFGSGASHTINPFNKHQLVKIKSVEPPYRITALEMYSEYDKRYHNSVFAMNRLLSIRDWMFCSFGKA